MLDLTVRTSEQRRTTHGPATVRNVDDYREFSHTIRAAPVDIMVVDPGLIRNDDAGWVTLLGQYTSLPLVLYAGLSPGSVQAIVSLARLRAPYIIERDFDSEGARLAQFISEVPPTSLDRQVLARIAEPLDMLPHELAIAVRLLYARVDHAHSVDWLASSSRKSRRWVERHLTGVGFMPAARLVLSPWLLRAHHYLRDEAFTQRDVARKIGVASPHTLFQELGLLRLHSRQDIGCVSSTNLVNRVVHAIYAHDHAA